MNNLKDYKIEEIVNGLLGSCFPYGSESYDSERYKNLLLKIKIVDVLIDEIVDSSKLYNRGEYSIKKISNEAKEYLESLVEWLNGFEFLEIRVDDDEN